VASSLTPERSRCRFADRFKVVSRLSICVSSNRSDARISERPSLRPAGSADEHLARRRVSGRLDVTGEVGHEPATSDWR